MPAQEGLTGQPVYRQGRGVHEALVDAGDPEGREVALDTSAVIHQGVRVGGSIGVAVDELLQAQVTGQSSVPGVGEMGG
jgi:hypothetical protein